MRSITTLHTRWLLTIVGALLVITGGLILTQASVARTAMQQVGILAAPAEPAAGVDTDAAETDAAETELAAAETELAAAEAGQDTATEVSSVRTYIISPEESEASYVVTEELFADALTEFGLQPGPTNTVRGATQAIEGRFTLDLDDLPNTLGENRFAVDMTTLSTGERLRDSWIRTDGPRFNDYPVAEFIASEIQVDLDSFTPGEEVSFQLIGELTIREISRPKTFDVTAMLEGDTVAGIATTEARLTEFDIEPPDIYLTLSVADPFTIEIDFVAHAQ